MTKSNDHRPRRIRLRVVNPVSTTSDPADVTAVGLAELEICGSDAVIGAVRSVTFTAERPCTRQSLAAAVTWPEPADVYVTYDLSRTKELIPPDVTGFASWIGVGRLLIQTGHELTDKTAETAASELGLGGELALAWTDGTVASRDALATALLTTLLNAILGGMNRLLSFSRCRTRPLRSVPAIDDAAGWAAMPRDDLDWVADDQSARALAGLDPDPAFDDVVTHRAVRELNRRRLHVHLH